MNLSVKELRQSVKFHRVTSDEFVDFLVFGDTVYI